MLWEKEYIVIVIILEIIAYSRSLNDTFLHQIPRFMYILWSEEGMCIYATSTSFCSLALLILQFLENLSRMLKIVDFYISSSINISSLFIHKAAADICNHQEFFFLQDISMNYILSAHKIKLELMTTLGKNTGIIYLSCVGGTSVFSLIN